MFLLIYFYAKIHSCVPLVYLRCTFSISCSWNVCTYLLLFFFSSKNIRSFAAPSNFFFFSLFPLYLVLVVEVSCHVSLAFVHVHVEEDLFDYYEPIVLHHYLLHFYFFYHQYLHTYQKNYNLSYVKKESMKKRIHEKSNIMYKIVSYKIFYSRANNKKLNFLPSSPF